VDKTGMIGEENLVFLNVCSPEESELLPMRRAYVERMAEIVRNQSMEVQKRIGEVF